MANKSFNNTNVHETVPDIPLQLINEEIAMVEKSRYLMQSHQQTSSRRAKWKKNVRNYCVLRIMIGSWLAIRMRLNK